MQNTKSIILITAITVLFFSCFLLNGYRANAVLGKTSSVSISRITNIDDKATVTWKKNGGRNCTVYVKQGKGKYKIVGYSKKRSFSFDVQRKRNYTVRIKIGGKKSDPVKFTANNYSAPKIVSVSVYPKNGKTYACLTFKSKKGRKYAIYHKTQNGNWKRIKIIKAKSKTTKYKRIIKADHIYTVRRYQSSKNGKIKRYGKCDKEGIRTLIAVPAISLDATNLKTTLSWNSISGADGYLTYIKVGKKGSYRILSNTKDTNYSYMYYYGLKTKAEIRATAGGDSHKYFVDPDSNPFVYKVRAYHKTGSKISYGNYLKDGEYSVITPNILSYDSNTLRWHTVKNADYYKVYTSADGKQWKLFKRYIAGSGKSQKATVPSSRYYGVSSVTRKNGKLFESNWDRGFDVSHRNSNRNLNMFWIGCSTEFASPYYTWNDILHINSYPYRISQCTGASFYNPAIPGATLAARYNNDGSLNTASRYRLVRNVVEKVKNGQNTDGPYYCETENRQTLDDFDIVMIPAGGNDYTDDIQLGSPDDMVDTTFYGALNMTVKWIEEASERRVSKGKPPIKIVFLQLVYGERYKSKFLELHDRFTTPNSLGKTYQDYQDVMYDVYQRLAGEGQDAYWIWTKDYVTHENCPYATSDNIHPTRFTYSQMGNGIAKDMIEQGILH